MSRNEKKLQTRKSLMEAALDLLGKGESLTSISLREVAKTAGVVPTSFYRHFSDMEELGLNLADELGMLLRKLMRAARQPDLPPKELMRQSVDVYIDFVLQHRNHFTFMCQCRTAGTPALRNAIRNELRFFAHELASDVRQTTLLPGISSQDLDTVCQLIVTTVADATIDLLDLTDQSPNVRQEFSLAVVKKLSLIWLGANAWTHVSD
ncbi:DNA-binding transcriptional regulator FabR [Hahella sp. CCB-MM4]|nr:DNA-binding transcriptional regulator FabR [Hahella sp. CCB-MM4]